MARSQVSTSSYDVFLNFRGIDNRSGFTKYLYDALTEKGIRAFMDAENLSKGEEISDVLVKAIEGSKIAIIVFSESYASSTWCLDELAMILECKNRKGQLVIPIFYKVEPTVVRKQKDSFAEHMLGHERTYTQDRDKVLRWREALSKAASISGWDTKSHPFEKNLINEVVEYVFKNLSGNGSSSSKAQASAAKGYGFNSLSLNGSSKPQAYVAQGYGFKNDVYKEKRRVCDVYRHRSSMAPTDTKMVKGWGKATAEYGDGNEDDVQYYNYDDDMIEELDGLKDGQVIAIHCIDELHKMLRAATKKSGLAILYFTATWCGPSVSISPVFTSLAKEYPKVLFLKIDADEATDVFDIWKISAVPCFLFTKNGAVLDMVEGSDEAILKSACQNLMEKADDVLKVGTGHFFSRNIGSSNPQASAAQGYGLNSFSQNGSSNAQGYVFDSFSQNGSTNAQGYGFDSFSQNGSSNAQGYGFNSFSQNGSFNPQGYGFDSFPQNGPSNAQGYGFDSFSQNGSFNAQASAAQGYGFNSFSQNGSSHPQASAAQGYGFNSFSQNGSFESQAYAAQGYGFNNDIYKEKRVCGVKGRGRPNSYR